MTEEKLTAICFMSTAEQKTLLEQWAKENDRSVSYVMRQILNQEVQRRIQAKKGQKPAIQQAH